MLLALLTIHAPMFKLAMFLSTFANVFVITGKRVYGVFLKNIFGIFITNMLKRKQYLYLLLLLLLLLLRFPLLYVVMAVIINEIH